MRYFSLIYLSFFSIIISVLSFFNIIYSYYFNLYLNLNCYIYSLLISLLLGFSFIFIKKDNFKVSICPIIEYWIDIEIHQLLEAGGADAGKLELLNTPLQKARSYAEKLFSNNDRELDKELPNFNKNYELAQKSAKLGFAQRKDMPVIDLKDVRLLQIRLSKGSIDISPPYADNEVPDDPFPQGLDKKIGKKWVTQGLSMFDGDAKDDVVGAKYGKEAVGNLKPIQSQIYFDKSIAKMAKSGVADSKAFQTKKENIYIVSSDNRIIDGHHRFLTSTLIDPRLKVNVLKIDMPIKKLLELTLAYTDAIGNVRNK